MHVLHTWALHTLQSVQHAYMHMHNMLHALQSMLQLGERLEAADARADGLQRAQKQQARRELCDAVWADNLCDVSVALRGTDFMALGGLRLPRAPTPGQRDGNGLCPGLAVLRHVGDPAMQGPWLAAGGSLLWDPSKEERQVASLRVGLIAQPAAGRQLTLGFDEKGFLSGSFKAAVHDALSLRLNGKLDLNRKQLTRTRTLALALALALALTLTRQARPQPEAAAHRRPATLLRPRLGPSTATSRGP